MAALIRVKRRIDEDPLNALILNCKRRKLDNNEVTENLFDSKDEVSTILKFAGTVSTQDANVSSQLRKLTKDEAKELVQKSRKPNISARSRQEMRQSIHDSRFKVVNCFRMIKADEENEAPKEITVVDIEKQTKDTPGCSSTTPVQSTSEQTEDENFVYDLYLPENEQQANNVDYSDTLSIRPFDDLVYEDAVADFDDLDSDDSNDENNWRNEYPDTEENSSISESDMRLAMEDLDIDDKIELSSDDDYGGYNDAYVCSIDTDAIDIEDDIDYCDVERYGSAYARYKAKVIKKLNNESDEAYSDLDGDFDE